MMEDPPKKVVFSIPAPLNEIVSPLSPIVMSSPCLVFEYVERFFFGARSISIVRSPKFRVTTFVYRGNGPVTLLNGGKPK